MPAFSTATDAPPTALRAGTKDAGETALDFTVLYTAHSRAIYYLALRLLGDASRAEDAVHDVFLKAFRGLAEFRHASAVRTWLYRIALNHCKNLRQTWHQRHLQFPGDETLTDGSSGDHETPLRVAEVTDLGRQIQRALDVIPEEYRILILLVADEEMSYEQIADLTRQTCDAVRGKLYRARKAFAAAFKQTE